MPEIKTEIKFGEKGGPKNGEISEHRVSRIRALCCTNNGDPSEQKDESPFHIHTQVYCVEQEERES
jgi:hypothetical protein